MAEGLVIKNKLRIVRRVGRGGMGHVYEVYHEVLRVRRALKQIVSDLQDNPEIERRFLHEAQMMARLEHPHIVKVFDVDHEPGFGTYLLMEFIQGRDLGSLLRERSRFSYEDTIRIGLAVASALDCAHTAGLVHRDIKPANILLEEGTNRPVVTDFGIAKEVEGAGEEGFTKTGSFIGTYRYSSREQIRAEKDVRIDGRADVYSLGVVLYEISTGHRYLEGMPELKIASCVGYQDDWRPPLTFPDDLPEDFRQLIERSLEPNRDRRVESAQALMAALEQCLGVAPVRPWGPTSMPPPRGQAPPLAATATGAASALQEVIDAPTALEDSESGVTEERARERARLVVRLQGLRKAVDGQSVEFERLLKTLQGFDIPRDEFRQLDDMSQILHRVEQSEQEGEIDAAIASLEGLSDRLQRNSSRMEASLSEAIERSRDDLRRNWRQLVDLGPGWVDRDRSESVERLLTNLAGALAGHRWEECERGLTEAGGQIGEAWRVARERAGRQVESGLSALAERFEALRALSRDDADQSGVDPASLASEVTSALERGDLNRATAGVDEAVATLERVLFATRERETRASDEARARAEAAFAEVPRASAERLAAPDLARADARRQAGEDARSAGDLRAAAAAFAEAADVASALSARVVAALDAERADAEKHLREAIEQSRAAPDEVVGPARTAAESVLAAKGTSEAVIQRLVEARKTLAAAIEESAHFEAARAAEQSAAQALADARRLNPTADELRAGEGQIAAARAAKTKRDWDGAAERFKAAKQALEGLAREISERRERDDLDAARIGAESLLAALPRERARKVAAADLEAAEKLLATASAKAKEGDRAAAKKAFGGAAERLVKAREAVSGKLAEEIAELARTWEQVEPSIAGLVDPKESGQVEESLGTARRELEGLRLDAIDAALARGAAAIAGVRGQAEKRAKEKTAAELTALGAAIARLQRARPSRAVAKDTLPPEVGRRADALVAEGRPAAAVALVEKAARDAGKNADDEIARLEAECAGARDQLARLRDDLSRRAVRAEEQAKDDLGEAAAREKAALGQQSDGALEAALADWKAAAQALEKARERVDEGERQLLESARAELRQIYATSESAAAEIVGRERDAARALLERPAKIGETSTTLAAIGAARQALETVLAEAREQARAVAARTAAEAVQKRVAARGPKRRALKAPEKLQKDAAKSFDKRRWDEAARGFQAATDAYAALDAELAAEAARSTTTDDATRIATPSSKPPIALFAGIGLVVVLGVGAWLWTRQAPSTVEPQKQSQVDPKKTKADIPKKDVVKTEPKVDEKPEVKATAVVAKPEVQPTAVVIAKPEAQPTAVVAKPPEATVVAKVEPPPPAAPPPVKIASFSPDPARVSVSEGKEATFQIALADVPAGTTPKIEWKLGESVVARDVPRFTFKPDFEAAKKAAGKPVALTASVNGAEGPSQRWEIDVADVNRPPTLDGTTPPRNRTVEAETGKKVALAAKVSDPDQDELRYSWTVDGKAVAGTGPKLEVPVKGDEQVEVTATDGKDAVKAAWKIAALKSPFKVDTKPASLNRLAFASPQEFRADVPKTLSDAGVSLEWTVDGKRAGTGARFRFANDDPARIRKEPVKVGLRATGADGRTFSRDWSFVVSPPVPKLAGSQPKPGELSLDRGGTQVFALETGDPIGSQDFEFVFEVDGKRAGGGSKSTFDYRQADDRNHTIVGYVRDNFEQISAKQKWTIRPSAPSTGDVVARAKQWLQQYQAAFNTKDANRIGQLRGLDASAVAKLAQALSEQEGLSVAVTGLQVQKLDDNRVRLRYERTDRFTEARDGRPVERTRSVDQVVGVVDGQMKEIETGR